MLRVFQDVGSGRRPAGEYTMADGRIGYDLMNSICHEDECYALGLIEHKNPFPAQISEGFYRVGDVIKWIDEELSINRRAEAESTAPHRWWTRD